MACVFTEILHMLPQIPKRYKANASCHGCAANPIFVNPTAYMSRQRRSTFLLPKCVTSLPENGIAVSCPAGNASRILPSAALFNPRLALISGILLAQDEKQSPWLKKNTETATLICRLVYVTERSPPPLISLAGDSRMGAISFWETLKKLFILVFISCF